jgi:hypothetical protein
VLDSDDMRSTARRQPEGAGLAADLNQGGPDRGRAQHVDGPIDRHALDDPAEIQRHS